MLSALIIATQWRPPALPYRTISHLLCTQACSSLRVFAAAAQRARQHGSACCMRKLLQTLAIAMLPSRKVQVKPQAIHHAHTSCICPPVPVPKLGASLQYELHVRACVRSSSLARSLPSIYIHCSHWHACMHETTITE